MRNIFTLVVVCGILSLCSCGSGANDTLPVTPVADSSTSGSIFWFAYNADSIAIQDLSLNNIPAISIHATDALNTTDSLWECRVQVIDTKAKKMGMQFFAQGVSPTGVFTVLNNSSTFTDYTSGANKVYAIGIGSTVTITNASFPIKGNMNLTLYYNHDTTYAVDTFVINN